MKSIITIIVLTLTIFTNGQNIYTKAFGSNKDKPIIFLHGGPGYNCVNFEQTTAQKLSESGYYVIVYDRRGEGRSSDTNAQFTFKESFDDLNSIYQKYNLSKATLIGHSFGGIVATLFAEANPKKVEIVILVGAPVSLQATFKTILSKSKSIYETKNDKQNSDYISMIEKLDSTSIEYSSYCFRHAMNNGFYRTKNPTEEAKIIYSKFKTDTLLIKHSSQMTMDAPLGFWKNEKYTTIDLNSNLKTVQKNKIRIYGLYGKDDGLYANQQIVDLQNVIGENNLKYFDNCSHNVYIDQQTQFIEAIKMWIK